MSIKGNLRDMSVADLIQANCQDRKTTRLTVRSGKKEARLYFADGNLIDASLDSERGEEVVYKILTWKEGTFFTENGMKPSGITITKSWTNILLEGARRIDDKNVETEGQIKNEKIMQEEKPMGKIDDLLKEMGNEITGYIGSMLVGVDGINIAQHSRTKIDLESISAQMTIFIRQADELLTKAEVGGLLDDVITARDAFFAMRFLPGKQQYLAIAVDKRTGNLGNIRLVMKVYMDKIVRLIPK